MGWPKADRSESFWWGYYEARNVVYFNARATGASDIVPERAQLVLDYIDGAWAFFALVGRA